MVQDQSSFDSVAVPPMAAVGVPLPAEGTLDRVDELLSYFFDDALTANGTAELNAVLLADESARTRCFEMARLHADLYAYFRTERGASVEDQAEVSLKLVSEAIASMAKGETTES